MTRFLAALFCLFIVASAQAQSLFLANDGTFKAPVNGGVTITGPAVAGNVPIATSSSAAAWTPLFSVPNSWTALQTYTAGLTVTSGGISSSTTFTAGSNGGTGGQIIINAATSGFLIQTVPAVAGAPTATWGSNSGTPAVTASGPLAIATSTGNVTCATCATTTNGGALSATAPATISAAGVIACATCATTTNGGALSATAPETISAAGVIACATCATTTNGGALSATAPVSISAAGVIACATCATTTNGGALSATAPIAISAGGVISITSPLPVANGGTGDTGTAWTTYTPSPVCGSATITTNTGRSKTLGKTTWAQLDITITALGTCTNAFTFTLPNTVNSGAGLAGRQTGGSGANVNCFLVSGSATATCAASANFSANQIVLSGVYENQ